MGKMTLPEFIRQYISKDFNERYIDRIADDMIDIMTGNKKTINPFENKYAIEIMMAYESL